MLTRPVTRQFARRPVRDALGADPLTTAVAAAMVAHFPLTGGLGARIGTGPAVLIRAGSATYVNKVTGDIAVAAADEPRFEARGLLMEESRTNQVANSTIFDFTTDGWFSILATATVDAKEVSPGGTTAAKAVITSTAGATCIGVVFVSADSAAGTGSFWIAGNAGSAGKVVDVVILDNTAAAVLAIAQVTLSETPQRVELTGTATTATNSTLLAAGYLQDYGGSSDLEVGDTFWIDGVQYETGEGATSLIITTGTAATRGKDTLSVDPANIPDYTQDMSIAITFTTKDDTGGQHALFDCDGEVYRQAVVDNAADTLVAVFGAGGATINDGVMAHGTEYRVVFTYDADGDAVAYVNGVEVASAAVGTGGAISGTMTALYLLSSVAYSLHGWGSDVRIYNRALSAAEAKYA